MALPAGYNWDELNKLAGAADRAATIVGAQPAPYAVDPLSDEYRQLADYVEASPALGAPVGAPVRPAPAIAGAPGAVPAPNKFAYPDSPLFDQQAHAANLRRANEIQDIGNLSSAFASLTKPAAASASPQSRRLVFTPDTAWIDQQTARFQQAVPQQYAIQRGLQKDVAETRKGQQEFATAEQAEKDAEKVRAYEARRADPQDPLARDFRATLELQLIGSGMEPAQAKVVTRGLQNASFKDMAANPNLAAMAKAWEEKRQDEQRAEAVRTQAATSRAVARIHEGGAARRQRELLGRPGTLTEQQYDAAATYALQRQGVAQPTAEQLADTKAGLKRPANFAHAAKLYDESTGKEYGTATAAAGSTPADLRQLKAQDFKENSEYVKAHVKDKFFTPRMELTRTLKDVFRQSDVAGVGLLGGRISGNARGALIGAMKQMGLETKGMEKAQTNQALLKLFNENIRRASSGAALNLREEPWYDSIAGAVNDESKLRSFISAIEQSDNARLRDLEGLTSSEGLFKLTLDRRVQHLSDDGRQRVYEQARKYGYEPQVNASTGELRFIDKDGNVEATNVRF